MYQSMTIVGRLGSDPTMRYTPAGAAVTSFPVAVNENWTDREGNRQERVTWFRVSVWGTQADPCNQYLAKGREVLVVGRIAEPKPYQGQDGTWRASLDLNALNVKFLGGKAQETGGDVDDEDIPF